MKKILFSTLFIISAMVTQAQVEFGVQFSPTLSTTRYISKSEGYDFGKSDPKAGARFNAGPIVDIYFRDNIALSTGLWYGLKRTGVSVKDTLPGVKPFSTITNTQYLQVPLTIKFFTQEIVAGTRLNVLFGGTADFKVAQDKIKLDGSNLVTDNNYSKIFDASLLVGLGVEMKLGAHNKVYANIFYSRGLINTVTKKFDEEVDGEESEVNGLNSSNIKVFSDQYGISIGYKF